MRRLRLALVGVALALAVPVALLVARALETVELERRLAHEAVAARVFDEMEDRLSLYLMGEETRPFAGYARAGDAPEETFALARFQVDPDGRVHTSRRDDDALARRIDAWLRAPLRPEPARTAEAKPTLRREPDADAAPAAPPAEAAAEAQSPYDILGSLNRAAEERALRQAAKRDKSEAQRPRSLADRLLRAPEFASDEAGEGAASGRAAGGPVAEHLEAERAPAPPPGVEEPLVARRAEPGRLLLVRTVLRPEGGYRQGVVLDLERLGAWLEADVVQASALAGRATARFVTSDAPAGARAEATPAGAYAFEHRFAEPFDALGVRLSLAALPGVDGAGPIWGLAVLAGVLGAAGLLAVDRMAAVVVQFAERRQNFVAAVTHELKTPLTAIRMYGEMLRDGLGDSAEKRDRYARTITEESERLSRLIDNVLEFSRLERGTREMSFVVGALGPAVEEAVRTLRPHAAREGFTLRVEVEEGLPPVRYDRDALVQILFNLVDNALKYAATASRREVLLACARHADGRRVALSVRDFGPGVPRRHLARVFEPFVRSGDELTRTARGTGIGLALVKELGERMGAAVVGANAGDGGFRVGLVFEAASPAEP